MEGSRPSSGKRELVDHRARDLRRGFTLTLLLLVTIVWIVSLAPLVLIAHRISKPVQELTAGLTDFAAGDWSRRLETRGRKSASRNLNARGDASSRSDAGARDDISAQGDMSADGAGLDEIGRAVHAFNHMADQLRQQRERLVYLTQMAS
jgi:HAMP domain-containing protein